MNEVLDLVKKIHDAERSEKRCVQVEQLSEEIKRRFDNLGYELIHNSGYTIRW